MLRSMTSFGRAAFEKDTREYLVEIKTVNHKYNDITVKINKNLSYLEDSIRKLVLEYISRGKIEIYIDINDYSEDGNQIKINRELVKSYVMELTKIANENNITNDISAMNILKLPDVLKVRKDNEIIETEILYCAKQALENLLEMRILEGGKISQDLLNRLENIVRLVNEIENHSKELVSKYKEKLEERIKQITKEGIVDENRLAQEIVIYADKISITEELTRLKSHCLQFKLAVEETVNVGKKLDFIVQEMNREINTIASKANCINISNLVISVKTEIENIREQIQNVE